MDVLITFTGFHDPFFQGLIEGEQQTGPILSLLSARRFEAVYLLSTPRTERHTRETEQAVARLHSNTQVVRIDMPLDDPTDYRQILSLLRNLCEEVQGRHTKARFFVAVASGTPQMHACWFLLVAGGELPAKILHVRPPQFVTADVPLASEVDLTDGAFPTVRFLPAVAPEAAEGRPSPDHLIRQLGIVGDHPEMREALATAALLAPASVPVLVLGETGTGKEVFSRFVHLLSGRPREAFFPVNCAALPHELVESILFGHKKGAFSGAVSDQKGKFEAADGGTLFLDEIGELPAAAQAKLLRVLQDGVVEPLGATKPKKVNVRLVAATNRDLAKEVREGRFREDLYYRVNCGVVQLPPLRSRRTDIPKLALGILDQVNRSLKRPKRLSADALSLLQMQDWPGNVRDLRNVLERSALLCKRDVLNVGDLQMAEPVRSADPYAGLPEPAEGFSLDGFLSGARRHLFEQALAMAEGNQSRAAKLLGISSQAVHKFLQERKR